MVGMLFTIAFIVLVPLASIAWAVDSRDLGDWRGIEQ